MNAALRPVSRSAACARTPSPAASGRRIALVTQLAAPSATDDDRRLIEPLVRRCEARVDAVPWDAGNVEWERYEAVLLRSTWNYHLDPARFLEWTERLEALGVEVWNPANVIRWNVDKRYLRDLEEAGVSVVPTEWIPRGADTDLAGLLQLRGWRRAVVKPSVAATAFRTWSTVAGDFAASADQDLLTALLADADALVQPFLEPIVRDGEWSFVYFADALASNSALTFSHAVVKRPAYGDFRVQEQFGGSAAPAVPPPQLRCRVDEMAAAIDRLAPGSLLYARLDGVVSDGEHAPPGTFLLMEAELIEPVLFLGHAEHAAERFAAAVAARRGARERTERETG